MSCSARSSSPSPPPHHRFNHHQQATGAAGSSEERFRRQRSRLFPPPSRISPPGVRPLPGLLLGKPPSPPLIASFLSWCSAGLGLGLGGADLGVGPRARARAIQFSCFLCFLHPPSPPPHPINLVLLAVSPRYLCCLVALVSRVRRWSIEGKTKWVLVLSFFLCT